MKKPLILLTLTLGSYLLTSCATSPALANPSLSSAAATADANGDGVISDAEFQKYKQATGQIQSTNPGVNAGDVVDGVNKTTRTLRDSLITAQLLRNFL